MKVILEFGRRGGRHVDNLVFPSKKLALQTADALVMVFSGEPGFRRPILKLRGDQPRATWQSSTHFVAVTVMDGVLRGPASAQLWKEEK